MKKLALTILFPVFIMAASPSSIVSKVCSECHGIKMDQSGMGVSKPPASLSEAEIAVALVGYKSGMRSQYGLGSTMTEKVSDLTNEEIRGLSKYISSLK